MKQITIWSNPRLILSAVLGVVCSILLAIIILDECSYGDPPEEIAQVENQIKEAASKLRGNDLTWQDIEQLGKGLTYFNERRAKAKVLCLISSAPSDYTLSSVWDDRFTLKEEPWDVKDLSAARRKAITWGILSICVSVPSAWLLLLLLSVIWYFLLERIRELSNVLRGRPLE